MNSGNYCPRAAAALVLAVTLGTGLLVGCSSKAADSSVAVTGTSDACTAQSTSAAAGNIEFKFTNEATEISELYVLKANGDIVGEVENVANSATRNLSTELDAGVYTLRCKPGQSGKGFTSEFTVTD